MSLRDAIVQGNTALLGILLVERDMPPYSPVIPLTQEHVRLAIFEGGCNTKIINMLLEHVRSLTTMNKNPRSKIDVRLDDLDMLEWAIAKAEEGDDRGQWLLRTIKEWENYGFGLFHPIEPLATDR